MGDRDCRCAAPSVDQRVFALFPRYTTLLGSVASGYAYYSDAVDVTEFIEVRVDVTIVSIAGSVGARVETSSDGIQWRQSGPGTADLPISSAGSTGGAVAETLRYVRLVFDNWNAPTDRITMFATLKGTRKTAEGPERARRVR